MGHVHIVAHEEDTDPHDHKVHETFIEALHHDIRHALSSQFVTKWIFTAVSKFRFHKPVQAISLAHFLEPDTIIVSPIPSLYQALSFDGMPHFILSNRLLSITDLPPPTA